MGVNVFLEHVYGRECVSGTRLWAVNVFLERLYGRECVSGTRLWA